MCLCVSVLFFVLLVCSDGSQNQEVYSHVHEQTQKHLDSYAKDGLRTLCIAKKVTLKINVHIFSSYDNTKTLINNYP